jgi:hypothetical protein
MFFDVAFSQPGRKSEEHLHGLRKQLGVGVDPAFDYTQMAELSKKVSKKEEKKKDSKSEGLSDERGPLSGLEQLRRALKDVVGTTPEDQGEREEASNEALKASGEDKISPAQVRATREAFRPTSSFIAVTRDKRKERDIGCKPRAPPIGSYRAKDDVIRHLITRNVDFGLKPPTKSLRAKELERTIAQLKEQNKPYDHLVKHSVSVEMSEDTPENIRSHLSERSVELSKSQPHTDPSKNYVARGSLNFNVNSFTAGVLHGDTSCSHITRAPSWDFEKILKDDPITRDTYFQPGQYKMNMESVRPKLVYKTIGFGQQQKRKRMKEAVGMIEIEDRPGAHLPDRSLARSCPLLSSKSRLKVPDIGKGTLRPDHFKPADGYHDREDPEIHARVFEQDMAHDIMEASKVTWRRARTAESFDQSLTRQEELKRTRNFGANISLVRAQENLKRGGPLSTELLSELDSSPIFKRRLRNTDLHLMVGRDTERRHVESPSRHRDQGKATKFERGVRSGDILCDAQALSPLAGGILNLRASRTWEGFPAHEHTSD